jgi:hypothetical protein
MLRRADIVLTTDAGLRDKNSPLVYYTSNFLYLTGFRKLLDLSIPG